MALIGCLYKAFIKYYPSYTELTRHFFGPINNWKCDALLPDQSFLNFIAYNLKQMRVNPVSIRVPSSASEAAHSGLSTDVVSQSGPR